MHTQPSTDDTRGLLPDVELRYHTRWMLAVAAILSCAMNFSPVRAANAVEAPTTGDTRIALGREAFETGNTDRAIELWSAAAAASDAAGDDAAGIDARLNLAAAYQSLGDYRRVIRTLLEAAHAAERTGNRDHTLAIRSALGGARVFMRQYDAAANDLDMALAMAREDGNTAATGVILNNLGNLQSSTGQHEQAISSYRESFEAAKEADDPGLAAKALVNATVAATEAGNGDEAAKLHDAAIRAIEGLADSRDKAYLLITLGQHGLQGPLSAGTAELEQSRRELNQASDIAERTGDGLARSYALGYLGQVLAAQGQTDNALIATRRAVFFAQQVQSPHALYRWLWQTGRLLRARGENAAALEAYAQAASALEPIRHDLAIGYGNKTAGTSFRDSVGPLFYEQADLLLQQADATDDPAVVQRYLNDAQQAVELLKSAEMEDYFQDECVNILKAKTKGLQDVGHNTAVVYLIPLPDRTELLLTLPSGLKRITAHVPVDALYKEVRLFRQRLETRTTHQYMKHGRQIYDWLVRPIDATLQSEGVDTLIFVPDGALRTIPMGALHDGEQFLISKYAIAVTPGLTLMDPKPIRRDNIKMLMTGLTESVQGFQALEHVQYEIDQLQALFGGGQTLMNEQFRVPNVEQQMNEHQFSIVHIASHGEFNSDSDKTYLLTYDDKLTLDGLEQLIRPIQFRNQPVELLTLSACQTAAGDDRAALGLAGIAIKAGARSALATLWYVNDAASADLVSEVYTQMSDDSGLSKAKALQRAKQKLIDDPRYRHPCYWSPYLIIGNWL